MPSHRTVYSLTRTRLDRSLSDARSTGKLTRTVLPQANAYAMIRRRPAAAGVSTRPSSRSLISQTVTPPPEDLRRVSFQSKYLWL